MINQAMFLRNGKSGYVLKPASLRPGEHKIKDVVSRRKIYALDVTIISAQQLPRPRDKDGRDIVDKSTMDPYVRVTLYVPDWPGVPKSALSQEEKELLTTQAIAQSINPTKSLSLRRSMDHKPASGSSRYVLQSSSTPAKVIRLQTDAVKNNGFNPAWQTCLKLRFEVAGDMLDLVFIRFSIRNEGDAEDERALAMYCTSLGSLKQGRSSSHQFSFADVELECRIPPFAPA
jgi:phosphatidylinositol phospholipase C, delta